MNVVSPASVSRVRDVSHFLKWKKPSRPPVATAVGSAAMRLLSSIADARLPQAAPAAWTLDRQSVPHGASRFAGLPR